MNQSPALVEDVLITLRRVIRAIDLHSRQLAQQHGLTVPQLMVLKEVREHTEPSLVEIARSVHLSKPTVKSILDRLERRGWIQRSRSPRDRRRLILRLTDAGQAVLEVAPPLLHEQFASAFSALKDWEQTLLLSSLQRVADLLQASGLDAAPLLSPGPVAPPSTQTPALEGDVR